MGSQRSWSVEAWRGIIICLSSSNQTPILKRLKITQQTTQIQWPIQFQENQAHLKRLMEISPKRLRDLLLTLRLNLPLLERSKQGSPRWRYGAIRRVSGSREERPASRCRVYRGWGAEGGEEEERKGREPAVLSEPDRPVGPVLPGTGYLFSPVIFS